MTIWDAFCHPSLPAWAPGQSTWSTCVPMLIQFRISLKSFQNLFFFSLSARSEHLEYPCANFVQVFVFVFVFVEYPCANIVQTPIDSKRTSSVLCCNDCDNDLEKMTIKCHYNPIMDEYLRWPTKSKDAIFSKTKFILPAWLTVAKSQILGSQNPCKRTSGNF